MGEIALLQLLTKPVDTPVVDQILHPGMTPLLPVAVVPLEGDDRLQQFKHVPIGHIAEAVRCTSEGLLLVVGAAHATTYVNVAAEGGALGVTEQHQADVLGQQVHRVVAGNGDRNLEFAGQVGAAIERFGRITAENSTLMLQRLDFGYRWAGLDPVAELTINPEVEVGTLSRLRGEQISDVVGKLASRRVGPLFKGCCRGHHIAVDIATGRQGRAQLAHDRANHLFEVLLSDAMHLKCLASSDPQAAVT